MGDELNTLSAGFAWRAEHLEWPVTTDVEPGLAGVIACATRVVWLDPSSGSLAYRGIPIEDLVPGSDFESIAFLLIGGSRAEEAPGAFAAFRERVRAARELPATVLELLAGMDPETHPTRMLRAGVAALGCHELTAADDLAGGRHWRELRIVGQVIGLVEAIARLRRGETPRTSAPGWSLAEGVLEALLGRSPEAHELSALELAWVMYAAHGLDAPTFTSMIVASCLSDPYANVVAGLSALRGDRQGGATERVVEQLAQLASPAEVQTWVGQTLAAGGRIAGFGHSTLSMPDPRVVVMRKAVAALARQLGRSESFEVIRALESEATRRLAPRGVHVNLNLYGAPLFHLLGAEASEVPVLVAAARMAGLTALVHESLGDLRLFRPLSRYVGTPERMLENRGGEQ